jgi:hypothetical protein
MKKTRTMLAAGLLLAGAAQASESLSCLVQKDLVAGAGQAPKVTEFTWSTAHGGSEPTGPIKASIGAIHYASGQRDTQWGPMPNDTLTLNGTPLKVPAAVNGVIRFGKAFDYGNRVALAYLAEREDDSSATPSEIVLLLDNAGVVSATDIQPGNADADPNHCTLVE